MQLRDVMSHDVEIIHPEASLVEAARKMKDFDAGPVLVGDDSEIIGVITDRDIATRAVAEGRDLNATHVRDVMTRGAVYCFEDEEIDEAIRIMRQRHMPQLLVVNRDRELEGVVSLDALDRSSEQTADRHVAPMASTPQARPGGVMHRERNYDAPIPRRRVVGAEKALGPQHETSIITESHRETVSRYRESPLQPRDLTGRHTIAGLFDDRRHADRAIDDLKQAGFTDGQIGVVMRDSIDGHPKGEHAKETHAAEGALTGALGGGILGGVAGYLVAIGAITIPGLGAVLAGGALAEALGVVAGTAAVGAGVGAAAGGLVGVLVGLGIPEKEARHFERGFGAKDVLVTVKAGDRIMEALAIMEMNEADTGVGRVHKDRV